MRRDEAGGRPSWTERPFYQAFASHLAAACDRLREWAGALGEPLASLSRPFVAEFDEAKWTHPYSFPLAFVPWWILDAAGRLPAHGADLDRAVDYAYGAMAGYLYIRIQDDIYDEPEQPSDARLLLVGNELIRESLYAFGRHQAADSPFWSRFRRYWEDFGQATLWEMDSHRGRHGLFSEADVIRAGQKLSLAKAPCAAVLLDLGRTPQLEQMEQGMDLLQAANQLANDVASLTRDIESRSISYPIALATGPGFDWDAAEYRESALRCVLRSEAVEQTLEVAADLHRRSLVAMDGLASPWLDAFVSARVEFLSSGAKEFTGMRLESMFGLARPAT